MRLSSLHSPLAFLFCLPLLCHGLAINTSPFKPLTLANTTSLPLNDPIAPGFDIHFEAHPEWGTLAELTIYRATLRMLINQALLGFHDQQGATSFVFGSSLRLQFFASTPARTIERRILVWGLFFSLITSAANDEWTAGTWILFYNGVKQGVLIFSHPGYHPLAANESLIDENYVDDRGNAQTLTSNSTQLKLGAQAPQPNLYGLSFHEAWGGIHLSNADFYCPVATMLLRAAVPDSGARLVGMGEVHFGDKMVLDADDADRVDPPFFTWAMIIRALEYMVNMAAEYEIWKDWQVQVMYEQPYRVGIFVGGLSLSDAGAVKVDGAAQIASS